jgi:hypothetical protein
VSLGESFPNVSKNRSASILRLKQSKRYMFKVPSGNSCFKHDRLCPIYTNLSISVLNEVFPCLTGVFPRLTEVFPRLTEVFRD